MDCPKCGTANAAGAGACGACGARLGAAAPEDATVVTGAGAQRGQGLQPGEQLGDRYEILAVLGEGGFGAVYKARDRVLERTVALKLIHPALASNPEVMERFKREILLASQITHKNVIRIHDLGEVGPLKFISMNFVEGRDLKERIRSQGALPLATALSLMRQIGEALAAAHEAGVVHRDLKPQNVLVGENDHAYIVDFGISRSVDHGKTMTEAGSVMGTIAYMSPEQARGELVDHRTDIYSFGLIAYEMLTGGLPFEGGESLSSLSVLMRRVQEEVPPVETSRHGLPPWITHVVSRCLRRDPAQRYPTVREILRDLDREHASPVRRGLRWPAGRTLKAAGAVALVAALAAAGILFLRGRGEAPVATGPTTPLALVPFRNSTGDPALDWTSTGLPNLLRSQLQQSPSLRVIGEDRVAGIIDGLKLDQGSGLDPAALARIAKALGVERLVAADLYRTGAKYRLESRLVTFGASGAAGSVAIRVEGEGDGALFSMVDELGRRLTGEVGIRGAGGRKTAELSTHSVEALRLFTDGVRQARAGSDLEAAGSLEAALAVDPDFAMARGLLAETYARLGRHDEALAAAEEAARGLRDVSRAEAARVGAVRARLLDDAAAAKAAYDELTRLAPGDPDAQVALGTFLEEQGDLEAALAALTRAVELDPASPGTRYTLGRIQAKLGNLGDAQREFMEALGLHTETGNEEGRATVLNGLGNVSRLLGKGDQALRYFEESLAVRTALGDRRGSGVALNNIATIQLDLGRYDEAIETQRRSLAVYEELGDKIGLAAAYSNLGEIFDRASRPEDALEAYQSGLDAVRDSGDEASLAGAFANLGYIYTVLGRYNEAFFIQKDALATRRKLQEPGKIVLSLVDLGLLEQFQGRYDEALRYCAEGLELARQIGNQGVLVALSANVAAIHHEQGRYGAALQSAREAVDGARKLSDVNLLVPCLADLGHTLGAIGDRAGAEAAFGEALGLVGEMGGNASFQATLLTHRGTMLLAFGESAEARRVLGEAQAAADSSRDVRLALVARLHRAEAAGSAKDLSAVAEEARSRRLEPLEGEARLALARVHLARREYGDALDQADFAVAEAAPLDRRDLSFQAHHAAAEALLGQGEPDAAAARAAAALELLEQLQSALPDQARGSFLLLPEVRRFGETAARLFAENGPADAGARLRAVLAP